MKLRIAALLAFAASGNVAWAHHSTAIFNMDTDIEIKGIITRYEWANPHVYLWVDAVSETGETINWEVEGGPPPILRRSGITRDMIAVGDEITIAGKAGRIAEKHQVLMNSLTKNNADSLSFGQADAIASILTTQETVPQAASSLNGTWGALLDMEVALLVMNPAEALLTENGKQARADIQEGKIPNLPACTPGTTPSIMMAPDIKHIELGENEVRLSREWDGITRVVDMTAKSHEGVPASLQGHAIGYWEGETLVIDTARFTANPRGNGYTLPSSEQKHVTEKLRLSDDGTHLLYSFVLEDAEYLAAALVSGEVKWTYRPDLQYQPLPCDPENAERYAR